MKMIIWILLMYIVAVAVGTYISKFIMSEDTVKKHLKVMLIGFGIAFVVIGALIEIFFGFF